MSSESQYGSSVVEGTSDNGTNNEDASLFDFHSSPKSSSTKNRVGETEAEKTTFTESKDTKNILFETLEDSAGADMETGSTFADAIAVGDISFEDMESSTNANAEEESGNQLDYFTQPSHLSMESQTETESETEEDDDDDTASTFEVGPLCYHFFGCGPPPSEATPFIEIEIDTSKLSTDIMHITSDISSSSSEGSDTNADSDTLSSYLENYEDNEQQLHGNTLDNVDSAQPTTVDHGKLVRTYALKRLEEPIVNISGRTLGEDAVGTSSRAMEELGLDKELLSISKDYRDKETARQDHKSPTNPKCETPSPIKRCNTFEAVGNTFRAIGGCMTRLVFHDEDEDLELIKKMEQEALSIELKSQQPAQGREPSNDIQRNAYHDTRDGYSRKLVDKNRDTTDESHNAPEDESLFPRSTISIGADGQLVLSPVNRSQVFREENNIPENLYTDKSKKIPQGNDQLEVRSEDAEEDGTATKVNENRVTGMKSSVSNALVRSKRGFENKTLNNDRCAYERSNDDCRIDNLVDVRYLRDEIIRQEPEAASIVSGYLSSSDDDDEPGNEECEGKENIAEILSMRDPAPKKKIDFVNMLHEYDRGRKVIRKDGEIVESGGILYRDNLTPTQSTVSNDLEKKKEDPMKSSTDEEVVDDVDVDNGSKDNGFITDDDGDSEDEISEVSESGDESDSSMNLTSAPPRSLNDNSESSPSSFFPSSHLPKTSDNTLLKDSIRRFEDDSGPIDLRDVAIEQEGDVGNKLKDSGFISDDDDSESEDGIGDVGGNRVHTDTVTTSSISSIKDESQSPTSDNDGAFSSDSSVPHISESSPSSFFPSSHLPKTSDNTLLKDSIRRFEDDSGHVDLRDVAIEQEGDVGNKLKDSGFISDDDDSESEDGIGDVGGNRVHTDTVTTSSISSIKDEPQSPTSDNDGAFSSDSGAQYTSNCTFLEDSRRIEDESCHVDLRDVIIEQEGYKENISEDNGFISDDEDDDEDGTIEISENRALSKTIVIPPPPPPRSLDDDDDYVSPSSGKDATFLSNLGVSYASNHTLLEGVFRKAQEYPNHVDMREFVIEQEGHKDDISRDDGFISDDDDSEDMTGEIGEIKAQTGPGSIIIPPPPPPPPRSHNDISRPSATIDGDAALSKSIPHTSNNHLLQDGIRKIDNDSDQIDLRDVVIEQEGDVVNRSKNNGFISDDDDDSENGTGETSENIVQSSKIMIPPPPPTPMSDLNSLRYLGADGTFTPAPYASNHSFREGVVSITEDNRNHIDLRDVVIEQEVDAKSQDNGFMSDDDDNDDFEIHEVSESKAHSGTFLHPPPPSTIIGFKDTSRLEGSIRKTADYSDHLDLRDVVIEQEGDTGNGSNDNGFISDDDDDNSVDGIVEVAHRVRSGGIMTPQPPPPLPPPLKSLNHNSQPHLLNSVHQNLLEESVKKTKNDSGHVDLRDVVIEQEGDVCNRSEDNGFISDDDEWEDNESGIGNKSYTSIISDLGQISSRTLLDGKMKKNINGVCILTDIRDVVIEQEGDQAITSADSGFISDDDDEDDYNCQDASLDLANSSSRTLLEGSVKRNIDDACFQMDLRDIVIEQEGNQAIAIADSGFISDDEDEENSDEDMRDVLIQQESHNIPADDNGFISDDDNDSGVNDDGNYDGNYEDCDYHSEKENEGAISISGKTEEYPLVDKDDRILRSSSENENGNVENQIRNKQSESLFHNKMFGASTGNGVEALSSSSDAGRKTNFVSKTEESLKDNPRRIIETTSSDSSLLPEDGDVDAVPDKILNSVLAAIDSLNSSPGGNQTSTNNHNNGDKGLRVLTMNQEELDNDIASKKRNSRQHFHFDDDVSTSSATYDSTVTSSANLESEDTNEGSSFVSPPSSFEDTDEESDNSEKKKDLSPINAIISTALTHANAHIQDKTDLHAKQGKPIKQKEKSEPKEIVINRKISILPSSGDSKSDLTPKKSTGHLSTISSPYPGNDKSNRDIQMAKFGGDAAALVSAASDLISKAQLLRSRRQLEQRNKEKKGGIQEEVHSQQQQQKPAKSFAGEEDSSDASRYSINDLTESDNNTAPIASKENSLDTNSSSSSAETTRESIKERKERLAKSRERLATLRKARGNKKNSIWDSAPLRNESGEGDSTNNDDDTERKVSSRKMHIDDSSFDQHIQSDQNISPKWLAAGNSRLEEKAKRRALMFKKFRHQLDKAKAVNHMQEDNDDSDDGVVLILQA